MRSRLFQFNHSRFPEVAWVFAVFATIAILRFNKPLTNFGFSQGPVLSIHAFMIRVIQLKDLNALGRSDLVRDEMR